MTNFVGNLFVVKRSDVGNQDYNTPGGTQYVRCSGVRVYSESVVLGVVYGFTFHLCVLPVMTLLRSCCIFLF